MGILLVILEFLRLRCLLPILCRISFASFALLVVLAGSVSAQIVTPTPNPTHSVSTATPEDWLPQATFTPVAFTNSSDCPDVNPESPSDSWLFYCGHCLDAAGGFAVASPFPTAAPFNTVVFDDSSTDTPTPTITPTSGPVLTLTPTAIPQEEYLWWFLDTPDDWYGVAGGNGLCFMHIPGSGLKTDKWNCNWNNLYSLYTEYEFSSAASLDSVTLIVDQAITYTSIRMILYNVSGTEVRNWVINNVVVTTPYESGGYIVTFNEAGSWAGVKRIRLVVTDNIVTYLRGVRVVGMGLPIILPTPTPAPTLTPTITPTPSSTPVAPVVPASFTFAPANCADTAAPEWDLPLDKVFDVQFQNTYLGQNCYVLVPSINLTEWSIPIEINQVNLCVTWYVFPSLQILGITLSMDLMLIPVLAWLVKVLLSF